MRVELVELVDIFCVNGNMCSIKAVNLGSPQDTGCFSFIYGPIIKSEPWL